MLTDKSPAARTLSSVPDVVSLGQLSVEKVVEVHGVVVVLVAVLVSQAAAGGKLVQTRVVVSTRP